MNRPTVVKLSASLLHCSEFVRKFVQNYGSVLRLRKLNLLFEVDKDSTNLWPYLVGDKTYTYAKITMVFNSDESKVVETLQNFDDMFPVDFSVNGQSHLRSRRGCHWLVLGSTRPNSRGKEESGPGALKPKTAV